MLCQTPNTILDCINVMSHALLSSFQCMALPLGLCSGVDIALRTARPSPCENRTFKENELQSATGTVTSQHRFEMMRAHLAKVLIPTADGSEGSWRYELKPMESSLKIKGAFKPVHVSTKLSQSLKTLGHKSLVV